MVGDGFELFDGGGALKVGGGEHDGSAAFFEVAGELATRCGFAAALEATHHDDGWAGSGAFDRLLGVELHGEGWGCASFDELVGFGFVERAAEKLDEPAVDDTDHFLAWFQAFCDLAAECVGEDLVAEGVDDIDVDVGLDEVGADFRHGIGDVAFADGVVAGDFAEEGLEGVG